MTRATIDGLRISYAAEGRGKPVLFIHGACENLQFWRRQLKVVPIGYRFIAIDLPGHGASERLRKQVSIVAYSEVVENFIKAVLHEPPVLVGHSMGGAIAIKLGIERQEILRGLVLTNTGAKLGVLPSILEGLRKDFAGTARNLVLPMMVAEGHKSSLWNWVLAEVLKCSPLVGAADFWACNEFNEMERVGSTRLPTLIVVGGSDQLTPVKWASFLNQNILGSHLRVVAASGHLSMLERPAEFNGALAAFLSRLP